MQLKLPMFFRFSFLRTCNCVLSERALKEVRSEKCPLCSKAYSKDDDVITLNGTEVIFFST